MILYKAIKYTLLDFCLDSLFRGIHKNFAKFKYIEIKELVEGMRVRAIVCPYTNYTFYDCYIKRISHLGNTKNGDVYVLYINCERTVPDKDWVLQPDGRINVDLKTANDGCMVIV